MKVIKQLSFHNNHVSRVNLYAVNVSKRATVHPWQPHFTCLLIWWNCE